MTQPHEFTTKTGTYRVAEKMGSGTYGTVYKVFNTKDNTVMKALKTFDPATMDELEGVPPTTIRELNALKAVKPHPNIIAIDEIVCPDDDDVTKMFFTMELCRGSLKDKQISMIERHLLSQPDVDWAKPTSKGKLPPDYLVEAKLVVWQLLNGLAYSHSWGIAHRYLKPANIMWGSDEIMKIGDFGLARFIRGSANCASEDGVCPQTGEVQTLWYRAPEVLMGDDRYGPIVDDWSVGCIMAELLRFKRPHRPNTNRKWEPHPIFQGDCEVHTFMMILEALGTPPIGSVENRYMQGLRYWSDCFPRHPPNRLHQHVHHMDEIGLDLLQRLLCIHPGRRTAARFLLDHPWFSDIKATIQSKMKLWIDDPSIASMYHFPVYNPDGPKSPVGEDADQEQIPDAANGQQVNGKRIRKPKAAKEPAPPRRAAVLAVGTSRTRRVPDARSRSPGRDAVVPVPKAKLTKSRTSSRQPSKTQAVDPKVNLHTNSQRNPE